MKLSELLNYEDIVIQCHDNPDADALASGYALHWYLTKMGKTPRLIYRGRNRIHKSNLLIMVEELEIPISYEPDFSDVPELLVTVDSQYGERNVTRTEAKTIAIIDHHQVAVRLPELSEVRSNMGSCATILWDMIRAEGMNIEHEKLISTALYYGLYTDTNSLSEISHPLDRDMVDSLNINRSIVIKMKNSNISLDELRLTGSAITTMDYHEPDRYIILRAAKCDPNILGVISDFVLETDCVEVCLAYTVLETEVKISVRSCTKEVRADELAAFLASGIGGGGGHNVKAGGTLYLDQMRDLYAGEEGLPEEASDQELASFVLNRRMEEYYRSFEILYAQTAVIDRTGMKRYRKRPQELGYVKATDLFPANSLMRIRTLEGDVDVMVGEDVYLMIGIEGEVYPINREKLEKSYRSLDRPYSREFEYSPSVYNAFTNERKKLMSHAVACISAGGTIINARPLEHKIKLFTMWDDEKYYSGNPGDYIAAREDDAQDIYIIRGSLFDQLYEEE